MRTRILLASTLYGAATLVAAEESGLLGPAGRRLLLVSNNAAVPETTPALDAAPGFAVLRGAFDSVASWNDAIRPLHPGGWSPRADEVPMWERYLRRLWGLGEDEVELVVESIQVDPALALCRIFTDSPVTVYADGLMSYGPTRNRLDPLVGSRIDRLLHLDLVPGLRPLLLGEFGVPARAVPLGAFRAVLDRLARAAPAEVGAIPHGGALLLGQYLGALGILSHDEEERLHLSMVRGAAARGHRTVLFKPHPVAPLRYTDALRDAADALGVDLTVLASPVLAETLCARARPALVAGCFSTGLFTAAACYGVPVARTGTGMLLRRLTPYENSNRVPVTLADALLPELGDPEATPAADLAATGEVTALVRAVGFAMRPRLHPELRGDAELLLSARRSEPALLRYFDRRRLAVLGLPGALPPALTRMVRDPRVRRLARRAPRSLRQAVTG